MNKLLLLSIVMLAIGNPVFAIDDKNCTKKLFGKCKQETITPVKEQEMTLGIVQREIKIGASMDEVAIALGSPNIVTRDAEGKDTWIYDKVSRITSYDSSGFGIGAGGLGGGYGGSAAGGGIIGVSYAKGKENYQSTQKTLTVVIKYDKTSKVESFTYHMSKF